MGVSGETQWGERKNVLNDSDQCLGIKTGQSIRGSGWQETLYEKNGKKKTEFRFIIFRCQIVEEQEATPQWVQGFIWGDENVLALGRCGDYTTL